MAGWVDDSTRQALASQLLLPMTGRRPSWWRGQAAGAHLKHSQFRCVLDAQVSTSEWPITSASATVMLTMRQAGSSMSSHAGPVKPKGHRQRPNWWSQVPRLPHSGWQGLTWCGLKGSRACCVQTGGLNAFQARRSACRWRRKMRHACVAGVRCCSPLPPSLRALSPSGRGRQCRPLGGRAGRACGP